MSNNPGRRISRQQQAAARHRREGRKFTPWLIALGVAAVLVVAVVAGVVAGGDDGETVTGGGSGAGTTGVAGGAPAGFAELLDAALPVMPDSGADPAVGLAAPGFRGVTFDGVDTTVDRTTGPRMIAFLAHWCPHCRRELPVVVDWLAAGGLPQGVELVAVSTGVDPTRENHPPEDWFAREGYPLPVVADSAASAVAAGYGLTGFPYWVVVDADGNVVLRTSGEKTPADLDAMAAAALS